MRLYGSEWCGNIPTRLSSVVETSLYSVSSIYIIVESIGLVSSLCCLCIISSIIECMKSIYSQSGSGVFYCMKCCLSREVHSSVSSICSEIYCICSQYSAFSESNSSLLKSI
ncbi:hypothetical protein DPMN_134254 [Dreissena polymorpha]|uniref:Uncharacterized protein n=1 Tax=Dreissena polymorpha TaxID=45954 RepID=A0A9D4FV95_DREPO|nr:hypothetical protein DPMN_134254 [Dreissena polymorpha]